MSLEVKKYSVTICGDECVNIDKVHDALKEITDGHLSVWEESTQSLRTSKE